MRFHPFIRAQNRRQCAGRARGFTLIELLVVIAIIGILSAVVLVSLNQARARGRDGRRLSDLNSLVSAMEVYFDQNGAYPSAGVGGCSSATPGPNATCFNDVVAELFNANLIPSATIADPSAGRVYSAEVPDASVAQGFIFGADLEQNNSACSTDYDGANFGDANSPCVEDTSGADDCTGDETDGIDFCIIGRES